MGTPERKIDDGPLGKADIKEVLDRIDTLNVILTHGKKRASAGCVASELLTVFAHALHEIGQLRNALER